MKSIFDSSFKYRPSFDTDVRRTFFKVRQEQQAQTRQAEQAQLHEEQAGENPSGAESY
jgi:hypothetical protein